MNISYRYLDINSESEIIQWLDLHSVCFNYTLSLSLWNHQYIKNPFFIKTQPLILIAEVDKKMVGSVSLIPSPIQEFRNDSYNPYHSLLVCKAMVHPDYQKKGIFSTLLKKSIAAAESEGYDVLLTISNNPYSYQSFQKIGFQDITAMRWAKIHLSIDAPLSKHVNPIRLPQGVKKGIISLFSRFYSQLTPYCKHSYQIQHGNISEFIGQISDFNKSTLSNGEISGIRSNTFITWRFFQEDTCFKCLTLMDGGRLLGYSIIEYHEGDKNAFIVDMCCSHNDKTLISILISETRQYLKTNNFQKLWVYIVDNDSNLSTFFSLRNGFLTRSSKSGKLDKSRLLIFPLNKKMENDVLPDKNTWNIQSCDTCWFLG